VLSNINSFAFLVAHGIVMVVGYHTYECDWVRKMIMMNLWIDSADASCVSWISFEG